MRTLLLAIWLMLVPCIYTIQAQVRLGDNLGNHKASQAINANTYNLLNVGAITQTISTELSLSASGDIGTAAYTVNVNSVFKIKATVAGLSFTLPTPSYTTASTITVYNSGSNDFTMYGLTVNAGKATGFFYNGTAWLALSSGSSGGSGWSLIGNTGTDGGSSNFVGTTDNKDLQFKRNNILAGWLGSTNTGLGVSSLAATTGTNNTAIGVSALTANTTGTNNTVLGYNAGNAITGSNNIAIGAGAAVPTAASNNQLSIGNSIYGLNMGQATPYIGINNSAPAAALDVTGNGKFSGNLSTSGNLTQLGTGAFTTGSGTVSLNGATSISGSNTFSTGTGSVLLNGNTTLTSGNSLTFSGSTSGTVAITASPITTPYPLVLPTAQGAAGTSLTNDGTGILSWTTGSSSSAISSLMSATKANTIDNVGYAQTWTWNSSSLTNALTLSSSAATTGNLLNLANTNASHTGNVLALTSNATAPTGGIAWFNFTGAHSGNGVQIDDATTTGTAVKINANALTTGTALDISSTSANQSGTGALLLNLITSGSLGATSTTAAKIYNRNTTPSNTGLDLQATGAGATNYGLNLVANNATTTNYGAQITASGAATTNYGIYASASGATTNYALYANGDVYVTGTLSSPSDARLKKNVATLTDVLKKIESLRGVSYQYIDQQKYASGPQVGVIAQELQTVFPELVKKDSKGYLSVNYSQLTGVLIQAIKEQQQEIDLLKEQMEKVMRKLDIK